MAAGKGRKGAPRPGNRLPDTERPASGWRGPEYYQDGTCFQPLEGFGSVSFAVEIAAILARALSATPCIRVI